MGRPKKIKEPIVEIESAEVTIENEVPQEVITEKAVVIPVTDKGSMQRVKMETGFVDLENSRGMIIARHITSEEALRRMSKFEGLRIIKKD